MKRVLLLGLIGFVLSLSLVMGADFGNCDFGNTSDYSSVREIIDNLDNFNSGLNSCELKLPEMFGFLVKNGNLKIVIENYAGEIEDFYVFINELKIESINTGIPEDFEYSVKVSEKRLDEILASENPLEDLKKLINEKEIELGAKGIWNNVKLFFGKFFI